MTPEFVAEIVELLRQATREISRTLSQSRGT